VKKKRKGKIGKKRVYRLGQKRIKREREHEGALPGLQRSLPRAATERSQGRPLVLVAANRGVILQECLPGLSGSHSAASAPQSPGGARGSRLGREGGKEGKSKGRRRWRRRRGRRTREEEGEEDPGGGALPASH
jgi:hypothetical protein